MSSNITRVPRKKRNQHRRNRRANQRTIDANISTVESRKNEQLEAAKAKVKELEDEAALKEKRKQANIDSGYFAFGNIGSAGELCNEFMKCTGCEFPAVDEVGHTFTWEGLCSEYDDEETFGIEMPPSIINGFQSDAFTVWILKELIQTGEQVQKLSDVIQLLVRGGHKDFGPMG